MAIRHCSACGQAANYLLTLDIRISQIGDGLRHKRKIGQFYLCESCEKMNRVVMERDRDQRARLARLLTTVPEYVYEEETDKLSFVLVPAAIRAT